MFDNIAAGFAKNYFIPNRGLGNEAIVIVGFIIVIVVISIILVIIV
jgi:hypothetical protein